MGKYILQVSYQIKPDARTQYLDLAAQLKRHMVEIKGKPFEIFELSGKKNTFVEQLHAESEEEFEQIEDDLDELTQQLNLKIQTLTVDGKSTYSTLSEI